jgi:hypothetical protein
MILYSNNLIVLDYKPETDVLFVQWPDLSPFSIVEIEHSFRLLIENLRTYDIKKLLIDSTKANADVTNPEYQALMGELAKALGNTRLLKIARVVSRNPVREAQLVANTHKMDNDFKDAIEYQNFEKQEDAHKWLVA